MLSGMSLCLNASKYVLVDIESEAGLVLSFIQPVRTMEEGILTVVLVIYIHLQIRGCWLLLGGGKSAGAC